jgi:hypothetical protein
LGIIEIVIGVVLVSGLTWLGLTFFGHHGGGEACTSVSLSPEVKAYIDTKLSGGGGDSCADLPKLISKVGELENKMGAVEVFRTSLKAMNERREQLEESILRARNSTAQLMNQTRLGELHRLKTEVLQTCSSGGSSVGVLKSSGSGKNQSPSPSIFNNLPAGTGDEKTGDNP